MIGHLQGIVLFSDGQELILQTSAGIGYQIYYGQILPEGKMVSLYVSHIIKENAQELYGHPSLRAKKLFELLLTVNGIGPKSAYALLSRLSIDQLINAVTLEQKKVLSSVPGIGPKASSQIILDLAAKIQKVKMYTAHAAPLVCWTGDEDDVGRGVSLPHLVMPASAVDADRENRNNEASTITSANAPFDYQIVQDTLAACQELGFNESRVMPLIQKIMAVHEIQQAEQLVHLVLKEI
ncbi:MAG: Holliday junction branch migration protein RuvA [Bacteriovoracaceae bacterium]|nr:Holliday junction branch migration protein RuvA [Bacteriovoracaceae bacterium]